MDVNIVTINGSWKSGYVLDKQIESSTFTGYYPSGHPMFDNKRTEIGENIYQLKYQEDFSKIDDLADVFVDNLKKNFHSVGFIVPMPPSQLRQTQPLIKLAEKVAEKMGVPIFKNILTKNRKTLSMKDIESKAEKTKALSGAFTINDSITPGGPWDVLIIDDLYDSGASLEMAAQTLATYSKVKDIYVGTFTRTGRT